MTLVDFFLCNENHGFSYILSMYRENLVLQFSTRFFFYQCELVFVITFMINFPFYDNDK